MSEETPKLHGWITPEYAKEIIEETLKWLNDQKIYAQITYCSTKLYEPKLVGWKNADI